MSDPKNAPAGSAKEPAASNPEAGLMPAPADYQFSSRKARRHAELTGMIPIVVPKTKTVEEQPQLPSAGKDDGGTGPGGPRPDTTADTGTGPDAGKSNAGKSNAGNSEAGKSNAGKPNNGKEKSDAAVKPAKAAPVAAKPDVSPKPAKVSADNAKSAVGAVPAKVSADNAKSDAAAKPAKVAADGVVAGHKAADDAASRNEKNAARRKPRRKRASASAPLKPGAAVTEPKDTAAKSVTNADDSKGAGVGAGTAAAKSSAVASGTKAAGPKAAGTKETFSRPVSETAAIKVKPAGETGSKAQAVLAAEAVADVELSGQEAAPRPVSAAQVTGIPVIPVPPGPIAAMPAAATTVKAPRTPKAGRDLPAAISVGLALLVLVIGSLLFYPVAFVAVATVFACVGVWEVNRAIAGKGISVPFTPVMVGALAMPASAYFAGAEGLLFALVASTGATVLWRSLDPEPGAAKSILAGVFSLMWIPFLLSFVFLMLRGEQGPTVGMTLDLNDINPGVVQVIIMLLLVVANDTFGYLVGVLFGKHPMAPKISPKKSWEGFAGSLAGATLVAIPATVFLLDQHWWVGFALAIGMVFAGTGGDFAESMVKRELGVKDMSNLLPGHGGVMDRLDSILFAAPVAYAIFTLLGRF